MKRATISKLALFVLAFLVLIACNLTSQLPFNRPEERNLFTQAAETFMVQLTQSGINATGTAMYARSTNTPPIPTETPTITPTATLPPPGTPTRTSLPTANTTYVPPTNTIEPTETAIPCNAARFVEDVSVPDNTDFPPGTAFTKTWRLENVGDCTWTTDYSLVFVRGDQMDGPDELSLPESVAPGERIDLSVDLTAPASSGEYRGNWMLEDNQGIQFGVGSQADNTFWVLIEVKTVKSGTVYDFTANYCSADWESGDGDLPCPGEEDDPAGFVVFLGNPDLENRRENEPALWTNPQMEKDGWISGTYPPIQIKDGDRFLADIGCLDGYQDCDVIFQLNYRIDNGSEHKLGEWHEVYDGDITRVNVDLDALDGEDVQFILVVMANGPSDDDAAFWLVPHIDR
jgi:hypothetical protein